MKAKKFIAGLSAMALASAMAMSAFAVAGPEEGAPTQITQNSTTNSGSMKATYQVTPSYTVTIPAGVTLDSEDTVSEYITADNVVLEDGQKIKVTLSEASNTPSGTTFHAKTADGGSTATYTIGKGEENSGIAVGDVVAELTADYTQQMLSFSPASGETKAGQHTEQLTFTVSLEDAPANVPVESITLNTGGLDLSMGAGFTVVATVGPDGATNKELEWTTVDDGIVDLLVSDDTLSCEVTALSPGNDQIIVTAKDGSGVTAVIGVYVEDPEPEPEPF